MNMAKKLQQAESVWLKSSFGFLKSKFTASPLPSHDHFHHLRVWNFARELCLEAEKTGIETDKSFAESLLLSCLFHDSGMILDRGKDHGEAGVKVFQEFLSEVSLKPADPSRIAEAIQNHDDKSYTFTRPLIQNGKPNLLTALHISDDLDALGYTGIYRYAEIYLLRGIPMEDLGLKIIANLAGRYGNFIKNCSRLPGMIVQHSPRHHTIEQFFRTYNLQLRKVEKSGEVRPTGPLEVIKNIYQQIYLSPANIEELANNVLSSANDNFVKLFFTGLRKETLRYQDEFS